jgi:hypothetical protein
MAKQKTEKVISSVELKDPNQVIHLKNIGLRITAENLTIERYQKLVSLSSDYEQYFNVKQTNKPNESELETKE